MARSGVSNNTQTRSNLIKRETNVPNLDYSYIKPQDKETFLANKFGSHKVSKPKENRKSQIGYGYSMKTQNHNGRVNPPGHDGWPSKCAICESFKHWA